MKLIKHYKTLEMKTNKFNFKIGRLNNKCNKLCSFNNQVKIDINNLQLMSRITYKIIDIDIIRLI